MGLVGFCGHKDQKNQRLERHNDDTWKVISNGRKEFGDSWYGSGGYVGADAFSIHFGNLCRDCSDSNKMRQMMTKILVPTIIWQGDGTCCMKPSRTSQRKKSGRKKINPILIEIGQNQNH